MDILIIGVAMTTLSIAAFFVLLLVVYFNALNKYVTIAFVSFTLLLSISAGTIFALFYYKYPMEFCTLFILASIVVIATEIKKRMQ